MKKTIKFINQLSKRVLEGKNILIEGIEDLTYRSCVKAAKKAGVIPLVASKSDYFFLVSEIFLEAKKKGADNIIIKELDRWSDQEKFRFLVLSKKNRVPIIALTKKVEDIHHIIKGEFPIKLKAPSFEFKDLI